MNTTLKELGCQINYEILRNEHQIAIGKPLTCGTQKFFEAIAPYLVMAHQAGVENRSLESLFPFIEEVVG